jgi:hypothetical protein
MNIKYIEILDRINIDISKELQIVKSETDYKKISYFHMYKANILLKSIIVWLENNFLEYTCFEIILRALFIITVDSCFIASLDSKDQEDIITRYIDYFDYKKNKNLKDYKESGQELISEDTIKLIKDKAKVYESKYNKHSDWSGKNLAEKINSIKNYDKITLEIEIEKRFNILYKFFFSIASDNEHSTIINASEILQFNNIEDKFYPNHDKEIKGIIKTFILIYLLIYNDFSTIFNLEKSDNYIEKIMNDLEELEKK